ncbi:alpha-glucosidase, partial [Leptospira borgpetersenii serovar Hardjo-bovis]|nr:alpha-glucosidase [Leptospira borgpetersenii serovar Hardjo-bovis]
MASSHITLVSHDDGFTLSYRQRTILHHSRQTPCLWAGAGTADIEMFRGNFSIKDRLNEKIALTQAAVSERASG